jgi:hypothetical protein
MAAVMAAGPGVRVAMVKSLRSHKAVELFGRRYDTERTV